MICLVNLPKYDFDSAPLSIAILQEVAKKLGHETKIFDLNLDLYDKSNEDRLLNTAWMLDDNTSLSVIRALIKFFDSYIDDLLKADMVAISFFSIYSIPYGRLFTRRLRQRGYTGKVVVGGPGISRHENAAELMLSRKLIDYFVTGDGEISFERIIKGELPYPGVNNRNPLPIDDLDSLPLPNFTGFDISRYPKVADRFTLSVEGSRGCVRDCTFCDIKMLFKKYRYKTGKRIFDEIMQIKEKHDVKTIWFTDSLVNGNQKEFRHFLSLLAAYNNDVSEQDKIGWTGQYIIRPKSQYTDEDFKLLKDSGCYTLATGLESYSEQVRHHLGKNFNNDDIRYYLEKCQEYDIKNFIMFIVGYPTETEDDFQKTLSFFEEYAHLADDNTITGVQLGHTMIWIPGAPISEMEKDLEIEFDDLRSVPAYNRWRNKNSDIRTRVMRRLKTQLHAMKHGFQVRHDEHHLRMFNRWLHG